MKICPECNNEFEDYGGHGKNVHNYKCESCFQGYVQDRFGTNKIVRFRKNWRYRQYGLDEADFYWLLESQDYRCFYCLIELTERTLNVDHDHDTGKVRHILCQPCNLFAGKIERNVELTKRILRDFGEYIS